MFRYSKTAVYELSRYTDKTDNKYLQSKIKIRQNNQIINTYGIKGSWLSKLTMIGLIWRCSLPAQ